MSHFSKIKTKIQDFNVLQKTLNDLDIKWHLKSNSNKREKTNIIINSYNNDNHIELTWNNNEYELMTDIQLWQESVPVNQFIDKINKQYAYNIILEESKKQGFIKTYENNYDNGNVKLVFQKWTN